jgi:hypothetical protein
MASWFVTEPESAKRPVYNTKELRVFSNKNEKRTSMRAIAFVKKVLDRFNLDS